MFEKIKNYLNSFRMKPVMLSNGFTVLPSGMIAWGGSTYTPEYLLGLNTDQLQKRSLQIWWESVHARGAVNQLGTLTVHTGLRLQSIPARRVLGLTVGEAQEKASEVEAYFDLIRQQKTCSYDGRFTFNELEIIGRKCWDIFGEVFAVFRYPKGKPVNVQLINPLSVKSPPQQKPGQTVDRGIELKNGIPVGFWVEHREASTTKYKYIPFVGSKSGRRIGVHCADIQTPDQIRGLPRLAPVFHELKRILEALKYELDSMATNATVAMVIQRSKPTLDKETIKKAFSTAVPLAPTRVNEIDQSHTKTTTGGLVLQNGKEGEEFKTLDTTRPNVNMPVFVDKEMEWIGPAIGLPATVWKMLFSSNYSASRGELELAWKTFDVENYRFSTSFEQEFYIAVVSQMVGEGRIYLNGWSDPLMKAAWLAAKWRGTPMPSLNPYQEAKASETRLRIFNSSHEDESQKANGTSFENNIERQIHEMRHMKSLKAIYDENGLEFDPYKSGFSASMGGRGEYADDMRMMYEDTAA